MEIISHKNEIIFSLKRENFLLERESFSLDREIISLEQEFFLVRTRQKKKKNT